MTNYRSKIVILFIGLAISSCLVVQNQFLGLAPGPWRAVLKLEFVPVTPNPKGKPLPEKLNLEFEEVSKGELPFTFEVIYKDDSKEDFHIEIINGEERIIVDDVIVGRDLKTAKDTILIDFPVYDSYIKAIYEENIMEGEWIVRNRDNYSIPFVARHGQDHRFTTLRKEPKLDLTGKWETTFEIGTEDEYKAIGEFQQNGNKLTGTFLTETGDYRFLEGTVQENKMYLSVFDGSHAFLFEAKITEEETLIGSFRSGTHYRTTWEAKRNPDFKLKDEGELTFLNEGYDKVNFSFPKTKGEMVSLDDDRYQGKVKIVNIFGTWCPNCRDEAKFLKEYLDTHPNNDLEVISLAFEKRKTEEEAFAAIERFRTNLGVNYEILYAGYYNKKQAAEALPMLNHILSYPTMIIIDKNDQVRRIHTGFSGPATSKYATFKEEFDTLVQEILREPI